MNKVNNWLGENAWGIIVAFVGIIALFVTTQSQVKANEARIDSLEGKIEILININQQILIKQAEMQKDVEFIKINVE